MSQCMSVCHSQDILVIDNGFIDFPILNLCFYLISHCMSSDVKVRIFMENDEVLLINRQIANLHALRSM